MEFQCSECECEITKEQYDREPEFPVCDICDAISDPT